MSSQSRSSINVSTKKPKKADLPATQVQEFRTLLAAALNAKDPQGRKWSDATWGVYAFFDYDGEPIYVGQTNEQLRTRVRRHLTNQRTDAVAMRILDIFEVAEIKLWPLWELEGLDAKDPDAKATLNSAEYTAYLEAIEASKFKAILNEKIPPVSPRIALPAAMAFTLVSADTRKRLGHPDIRIARRSDTISRLAAVAHERGEVSDGLRRVLVIQAVRLTYLTAERLAYVEGRQSPNPAAIDVGQLVGSVLSESEAPDENDEESDD